MVVVIVKKLHQGQMLSVSTKLEFDIEMGWLFDAGGGVWTYLAPALDEPQEGRYIIRMTLYFEDDAGEDVEITIQRTAYLKNYDNC